MITDHAARLKDCGLSPLSADRKRNAKPARCKMQRSVASFVLLSKDRMITGDSSMAVKGSIAGEECGVAAQPIRAGNISIGHV